MLMRVSRACEKRRLQIGELPESESPRAAYLH